MKYLALFFVLVLAACSLAVNDTPALRSAIEAKFGATVAPVSVLPGVLRVTLLTPPPVPTIEPSLVPTVTPTPEPMIKGNIASDGRKLYHVPSMRNYEQVVIDESKGERWFHTEQEAIDAGWTKAGN